MPFWKNKQFRWKNIWFQACNTCQLINKIRKNMTYNLGSKSDSAMNKTCVTSLNRLQSCYHTLRDLCVHTDGSWWKLKKDCTHGDISNYPDGCMIFLNSVSVGSVSLAKRSTQITKIMGKESGNKRNGCMVCSVWSICIFST